MQRFPQALYQAGGQEIIEGRQFTSRAVLDVDELAAALADGWHETPAACYPAEEPAKLAAQDDEHDDTTPPTRAELEQKATELGVEFSKQLGDKKLAERIAAKLAAQDA